jgi:myo-inositol-1(or 4)-monophosphatase
MHPLLVTAVKAARQAGRIIVRSLNQLEALEVAVKGRNDFVSEVDHAAEEAILDVIQRAYPGHGILAEESGRREGRDYEWIIDPLDGTTNFLHGHPQFAVSIAVRYRGRLSHAVIFDPLRDELFTASAGRGAQLNDRRMRVSKARRIEDALLGTGFPFRSLNHLDWWLRSFRLLLTQTSGIRRAGSAALDLAYVACGRFDGFWEIGLSPWDTAAGCLLIQEAGGLVSDLDGSQHHLETGNIVAGNAHLHPELLKILRTEPLPA